MQSWPLVFLGSLLGLGLVVPMAQTASQLSQSPPAQDDPFGSPYLRIDPEKIVLNDRDSRIPCGECHNLEYEVWRETPHATGFDELHRTDQAQAILARMDLTQSKRESLCLKCHYTATVKREQVQAIAGVSCESCHGAARDWVNLHQDYGGATRDTETAEHRAMRIQQSVANGMLRPSSDLYAVSANCFECHTVPEEELINVGGHPSGSNFDLIDWSDEIRHNFLQAQWGGSEANRARTPERLRLMYVIGKALDYEYSIRGAARATKEDIFSKAMERRVRTARRELDKILRVASIPEIVEIVRIGQNVNVAPNNRDALIGAAQRISEQAQAFSRGNDGSQLAALDPLVAGESVPLAEEPDEAPADDPAADPAADGAPDDPAAPAAETTTEATAPAATETAPAASGPSAPEVRVVGEKRTRPAWFPRVNQATLAPGGCGCHGDQLRWHGDDKHNFSAEPLLNESPRAVQIAQLYGLSTTQMKQGNQLCMNCHGTVVTGDEAFEVFDGVSCQSCHGPAAEYVSKHQPNGYDQGAPHGMVRLEALDARAANCARCHHITDERLLASGHSDGSSFQLGSRNDRIKHWEGPNHSAGDLNSAYSRAIGSRPVPNVQRASLPTATAAAPATSSSTGSSTPARPAATRPRASSASSAATRPPPPRTRPVDRFAAPPADASGLGLPPRPAVSDSTSTEDILLIVKQRLELLHRALGRGE